jgi:hypothetical protein
MVVGVGAESNWSSGATALVRNSCWTLQRACGEKMQRAVARSAWTRLCVEISAPCKPHEAALLVIIASLSGQHSVAKEVGG